MPQPSLLRLALIVEGGLALLALILGPLIGQPPLRLLQWNSVDALAGVVATLPLLGLFVVSWWLPWTPLRTVRLILEQRLRPLLASATVAELALVAALAGGGEELLFRGVLQGACARYAGPAWGLLLASLAFGAAHFITPTYFVLATLIGAYLGWLTQCSANLLPAILVHALYDFAILLFLRYWRTAPPAP